MPRLLLVSEIIRRLQLHQQHWGHITVIASMSGVSCETIRKIMRARDGSNVAASANIAVRQPRDSSARTGKAVSRPSMRFRRKHRRLAACGCDTGVAYAQMGAATVKAVGGTLRGPDTSIAAASRGDGVEASLSVAVNDAQDRGRTGGRAQQYRSTVRPVSYIVTKTGHLQALHRRMNAHVAITVTA
jgi:hypothetical protein